MGIDIGPIETTDLLAISFDVGNTRSYSGSGTTVNGLISIRNPPKLQRY